MAVNQFRSEKSDNKMKVAFHAKYGSPEVLSIKEVEIPTPKDNEVLIRVDLLQKSVRSRFEFQIVDCGNQVKA